MLSLGLIIMRKDQKEYYQKNKQKILAQQKVYYEANKEEIAKRRKIYHKQYWEKHKEQLTEDHLAYRTSHKIPLNIKARALSQKYRTLCLEHYGGTPPKCSCCNENQKEFLAIDHINGGGFKHRKTISGNFFVHLVKNNFPPGFQVLCHNCNMAKGFYGKCPHQDKSKVKY